MIKNDILFGARYRTGMKPLYFSNCDGNFFFASELKTLLNFNIPKEIDNQSLVNYLAFQFIPAPKTVFSNIPKIEARHFFVYTIKEKNMLVRNIGIYLLAMNL